MGRESHLGSRGFGRDGLDLDASGRQGVPESVALDEPVKSRVSPHVAPFAPDRHDVGQMNGQPAVVSGYSTRRQISETPSPQYELQRWPYLLSPVLYAFSLWALVRKGASRLLGRSAAGGSRTALDFLGPVGKSVKRCAGQWKALDIIYNYRFGTRRSVGGLLDDWWGCSLNCQAVRNRLRLAKQEIRNAILRLDTDEVRIVSLAAGSAQGVIEVASELKPQGITVSLLLIDLDPTALVYAKDLAARHGIGEQVEVLEADVRKSIRVVHHHKPHIVEMIGLMDYLPDSFAIRLIHALRRGLPDRGVFLTANIVDNVERHFVRWVMDWRMIYREPHELGKLLTSAGFQDPRILAEPLGLHGIAVATKRVAAAAPVA